jgi:hypothetical protein
VSGKITYRNGLHPTQMGRWLRDVKFATEDRERIRDCLGRELTSQELERLESRLTFVAGRYDEERDARVSTQDIKKTLTALTRINDDTKLIASYGQMDSSTECVVLTELHHLGERVTDINYAPFPERLRQAAQSALHLYETSGTFYRGASGSISGGAPVQAWRQDFACVIFEEWAKLGRQDGRAFLDASTGEYSPIVKFAQAIYHPTFEDDLGKLGQIVKILQAYRPLQT